MKKAKIMLMAIVVIGTVGGALAFKAGKFTYPNLYSCATTTSTNTMKFCILAGFNNVIGDPANANLLFLTPTNIHTGTPACTTTWIEGVHGVVLGCYDHPTAAFVNQ